MRVKIMIDTMCQRSGATLKEGTIISDVTDLSSLYYGMDLDGEERAVLVKDAAIMLDDYEAEAPNPIIKYAKTDKEKK